MAGAPYYDDAAANAPEHVPDSNLQLCYGDAGLEPTYPVSECPSKEIEPTKGVERRRKNWPLIIFLALVIVSIIGGVVGGVVGTKSRKSGSGSPTGNGTSPTGTPTTIRGIRPGSALAAVAYYDTAGIGNHRVYYQDESNKIRESAWDEVGRNWTVRTLLQLPDVRAGSPLAAAVKQPPNPQINLYYLDTNNTVQEWVWNREWSIGEGSRARYKAAASSKLAAEWQSWGDVLGTICLVYQADDGNLQFANGTENDWESYTLDASPKEGTGLAMVRFPVQNGTNQLRLYYQRSDGVLTSNDWRDNGSQNTASSNGTLEYQWRREGTKLEKIEPTAPISAFVFYGTIDNGGFEYLQVLSSGSQGITADWWSSSRQQGSNSTNTTTTDPIPGPGWRESQHPTVMATVENYTAVAAHSQRRAYAMQDGKITEFTVGEDGVSWTVTGNVPTT